jgi:tetratricopeptide (TPR) repeat protein
MTMKDMQGLALSGANAAATDAYIAAQSAFKCYIDDPVALADQAIEAAPGMPMPYVMKAWLNLLGTEPAGTPVALEAIAAAEPLAADERERLHLRAATQLAHGHWYQAGRTLEDLSVLYPRDLLALQAGHQIDFFTGDSRMLRDRIARALPHWQRGMPGYHAVLGMHAFGLEETGDYAQAERQGRLAVELEPRDGWAWHAVAHVQEMRNDPAAGVEWLGPNAPVWSDGSFFAVHNWWHLALFHLELGRVQEVLRLYDEAIGTGSSVVLDLIDASAMLWRLKLRGVDVGQRWDAVADLWQAAGAAGQYAFNDMHMMIAYVGAGRTDAQRAVLEAQDAATAQAGDNAQFTRVVGQPATQAILAFGRGEYAACADLLRGIRSGAHRFGGSHAQRDLIDLTLLEAARRAGQDALAQALAFERQALRPRTAQALAPAKAA